MRVPSVDENLYSRFPKPEGKRGNEKRTWSIFRNQAGDSELDSLLPYANPQVIEDRKQYGRLVDVGSTNEEVEDVLEIHILSVLKYYERIMSYVFPNASDFRVFEKNRNVV